MVEGVRQIQYPSLHPFILSTIVLQLRCRLARLLDQLVTVMRIQYSVAAAAAAAAASIPQTESAHLHPRRGLLLGGCRLLAHVRGALPSSRPASRRCRSTCHPTGEGHRCGCNKRQAQARDGLTLGKPMRLCSWPQPYLWHVPMLICSWPQPYLQLTMQTTVQRLRCHG